jgi:hypothetical protein
MLLATVRWFSSYRIPGPPVWLFAAFSQNPLGHQLLFGVSGGLAAQEVFVNEAAGVVALGFEDIDFDAMRAFGRFVQGKWIGGDRTRRVNSGAFEQPANHHRFAHTPRRVGVDDALSFRMAAHDTNSSANSRPKSDEMPRRGPLSTIARAFAQVHNRLSIHRPIMETPQEGVTAPTQEQIDEESRRIRRLRILVHLTLESIAGGDLSAEEAAGMIAATRRVALEMFPGKERAFDLIYKPQFQRVMHAVYNLQ